VRVADVNRVEELDKVGPALRKEKETDSEDRCKQERTKARKKERDR
jgi:hypothetical protein